MKTRILGAVLLAFVLLVLGGLNIYEKITWKEPTDGIFWQERKGNLTAIKVEADSTAYLDAGIEKGDILYTINNNQIKNKIDIIKNLWIAGNTDRKVTYQILHEGELSYPGFFLEQKGVDYVYFYLALVGLTILIIGFIVFVNSKKPFSLPYIFFYFISLAFYSFHIFSFRGSFKPDL